MTTIIAYLVKRTYKFPLNSLGDYLEQFLYEKMPDEGNFCIMILCRYRSVADYNTLSRKPEHQDKLACRPFLPRTPDVKFIQPSCVGAGKPFCDMEGLQRFPGNRIIGTPDEMCPLWSNL